MHRAETQQRWGKEVVLQSARSVEIGDIFLFKFFFLEIKSQVLI
jgi:hypothetical protein